MCKRKLTLALATIAATGSLGSGVAVASYNLGANQAHAVLAIPANAGFGSLPPCKPSPPRGCKPLPK